MPSVIIYAQPSALAIKLAHALESVRAYVSINCGNPKDWGEEKNNLFTRATEANYIILLAPFAKLFNQKNSRIATDWRDFKNYSKQALTLAKKTNAKLLLVLPLVVSDKKHINYLQSLIQKCNGLNFKVVWLGEVFGANYQLKQDSLFANIARSISGAEAVNLPLSSYYFISVEDAVWGIAKSLFGYWKNAEVISMTDQLTRLTLVEYLNNNFSGLTINSLNTKPIYYQIKLQGELKVPRNSTIKQLIQALLLKPTYRLQKTTFTLPKIKIPSLKKKFAWLSLLLFIIIAPFLILAASIGVSFIGAKTLLSDKPKTSLKLFNVAQSLSQTSQNAFILEAKIPLVGGVFDSFARENALVTQINAIASEASQTSILIKSISSGISAKGDYDLESLSRQLTLSLDQLYTDSSFLEGDIDRNSFIGSKLPTKEQLTRARALIVAGRDLSARLPDLIGGESTKTYLFLFQNNMELRPTGGFIGSFALVSFRQGKLIDHQVMDVYSADGQLKGFVAAPSPIVNYLGEASWYLRDSNWDPDFVLSAERAQWFLEKEIDRKTDGVIGIDLEVAKDLLSLTGPIDLPDFGTSVTEANLYEKIQTEVESNFFPGSQKKANLLSELATQLLNKLTSGLVSNFSLGNLIYDNLNSRHIQIALADQEAKRVLKSLNWDGKVSVPDCGSGCKNIWVATAEANLGVNKANYYLSRQNYLEITPGKTSTHLVLKIDLANSQNQELSIGGDYKGYLRVLAPSGSSFNQVKISDGTGKTIKTSTPEISKRENGIEAGVLVNVPRGQARSVIFDYIIPVGVDTTIPGRLQIYYRKQAGISSDPTTIKINSQRLLFSDPAFSLTGNDNYSYNTILEGDFLSLINW